MMLSTEIICCGLPTIVDMPETLRCQKCSKGWMNLVQGVNTSKILPTEDEENLKFTDQINF